jgi:hypothetical protein
VRSTYATGAGVSAVVATVVFGASAVCSAVGSLKIPSERVGAEVDMVESRFAQFNAGNSGTKDSRMEHQMNDI